MNKHLICIARKIGLHKWLLLALCVSVLFNETINQLIVDFICPITSQVKSNDYWVWGAVVAIVCIGYGVIFFQLSKERDKRVSRYETIGLLLIIYLIFRLDGRYEFAGFDGCVVAYTDWAWICVGIIEGLWMIKRIKDTKTCQPDKEVKPFLPDSPSADNLLQREEYAKQLIRKISATLREDAPLTSSFAILLNEQYGAGKTSFMLQIKKMAEDRGIRVCWFKPWLYEDSQSLVVNFIHVLQEELGGGDRPLQKRLGHYAHALSSIDKFEWVSLFLPEELSVETQFEEIKERLQKIKQPLIVFIDDVDRLQSEELLRMLQMVRNAGDFPYVHYLIAADKVALQNRLKEVNIAEPEEYLKKFFNLEMFFPADDIQMTNIFEEMIVEVLKSYPIQSEEVLEFIKELKYKKEIFATIRDMKRYLNLLDYTMSVMMAKGTLIEVSVRDVAGICLVQYLDTELYKTLRDHNEYLLEPNRDSFRLKKDYELYFANREDLRKTDEWIEDVAAKMVGEGKSGSKPKKNTQKEKKKDLQTIREVLKESKPLLIEILGNILELLFSPSYARSQNGVRYETEYFKYFASEYRKDEISNVGFMQMMRLPMKEYKLRMEELSSKYYMKSVRHKMRWFLQTQHYERLKILERIIIAAKVNFKYGDEDAAKTFIPFPPEEKEFFEMYYGNIIYDLFSQQGQSKKMYVQDWKKLRKWLVEDKDYRYRVYILKLLHRDHPYDDYIYESKKELNDCISESEVNYIRNQWSSDKYDELKCEAIGLFRDIKDDGLDEIVAEEIAKMKTPKWFWMRMVMMDSTELEWNNDFINGVFGGRDRFKYYHLLWEASIPKEWRGDLLNELDFNSDINESQIAKSEYLTVAYKWWLKKKSIDKRMRKTS